MKWIIAGTLIFFAGVLRVGFAITAPGPEREAVKVLKEIAIVHASRLAEYESLHARKLASSEEVARVRLDFLDAKLKLAYEKEK